MVMHHRCRARILLQRPCTKGAGSFEKRFVEGGLGGLWRDLVCVCVGVRGGLQCPQCAG